MQPNPQTRRSPRMAGSGETVGLGGLCRKDTTTANPVELILSRLDGVRQHGNSYRANCPVGHSSKGTLSIAAGDDGRVLMRCFACIEIGPVLDALGLQLADLFPTPIRDRSPAAKKERREAFGMAGWRAALGILGSETTVCEVALTMIERGEPLTPDDIERARLAVSRIHRAREVLA